MRKCFLIVLIIFFMLGFAGCTKGYVNQSQFGKEQVVEILRCFDEKDNNALKSLFCEKVALTHDLDTEIEAAMNLYNGKSTDHDKVLFGGGDVAKHGVITDSHIEYSINNIKTDNGIEYTIVTHSYIVYQKDPKCVGITYLKIINNETDEMITIGEYVH